MSPNGKVYLIPSFLHENTRELIPSYVIKAIQECEVFFVENERTARRYLKSVWKDMVIDQYEWFTIHEKEEELKSTFVRLLKAGKTIGIISEAGCPGIADPGQILVSVAQEENFTVKPLVGPSSILLALMASGMNGQQFQFVGYLPIDSKERGKKIEELEIESMKKNCTQVFIETPYRNNQLLQALLQRCKESTSLCIAVDITSPDEHIKTKTIQEWKKQLPELNKKPTIFLLLAKK
ncbi:MAG: SAM-dependent methyltransferase [Bacteroidetes bacterium]|nr:MAG: SAM-dependent methyltransferase [Bacteroidota bacterium]